MTQYLQAVAGVLLAVVVGLMLQHQGKEFSLLLTLSVCAITGILAASFLEPVIGFLMELESLGNLDSSLMRVLFKAAGIALISEISGMVCADAGFASLGKALQMTGTALILRLSVPVFQALLELIQNILGGI